MKNVRELRAQLADLIDHADTLVDRSDGSYQTIKTQIDRLTSEIEGIERRQGIGPGDQSRTSRRGFSQACQERSWPVGLRSAYLGRLVSSSNTFAYSYLVPDTRDPPGGKNILRP